MRFARKIAIAMIVILFTAGILQAQIKIGIEPKLEATDREMDVPMYQMDTDFPGYPGDPSFNLIDTLRVVEATGGDSSVVMWSWDFTGITFEVYSDTFNLAIRKSAGSVQFNLIIYTGIVRIVYDSVYNPIDTIRTLLPFDTLSVDTTGVGRWDHNLPLSTHFMYALEGAAGTDSTTRMYATVHRRRYEEEVPEIDIFGELYHGPEALILNCGVNHFDGSRHKQYIWRNRLWDGRKDVTFTIKD